MSSIFSVLNMVHPGDFLASIDLTEVYGHIAICWEHWRYLMFWHKGHYWCYTCVPNGISNGPHLFIHICKVLCAFLRCNLVQILIYIDDSCLHAPCAEVLEHRIKFTLDVFNKCGFMVNMDKSVLILTQTLEFLGFLIDTVNNIISVLPSKIRCIEKLVEPIVKNLQKKIPICHLAKIIGKIVSLFPASLYAPLHYRMMEHCKVLALRQHKDCWETKIHVSNSCLTDLTWW